MRGRSETSALWRNALVLLTSALLSGCVSMQDATLLYNDPSPDGKYVFRVVAKTTPCSRQQIRGIRVGLDDRNVGTPFWGDLKKVSKYVWELRADVSDCEKEAYYHFVVRSNKREFRFPKE